MSGPEIIYAIVKHRPGLYTICGYYETESIKLALERNSTLVDLPNYDTLEDAVISLSNHIGICTFQYYDNSKEKRILDLRSEKQDIQNEIQKLQQAITCIDAKIHLTQREIDWKAEK
jgi:peptidoglycan hydrolase CwlO-like protein